MKLIKGMICLSILVLGSGLLNAQIQKQCIKMGWTGGAVGSDVKWIEGELTMQDNSQTFKSVYMTYEYKNGKVSGAINLTSNTIAGDWAQDGSKGGPLLLDVKNMNENGEIVYAEGYWWSAGEEKPEKENLVVEECEQLQELLDVD